MIAKRVSAPKKTTSIKRLAEYISNPSKQCDLTSKERKEGMNGLVSYIDKDDACVRISNCGFDGLSEAIKEIQAIQKMNTRSQNDKTYHLVISFREGEHPEKNVLEQVEDRIVDKIGFYEHQRISALHTDTNNWHLHVAINKVHPVSYQNVEPYYDKFKMQEACRELEHEFGLLPDNGIAPNRKKPMNPAKDYEAHTGIKSLVTWTREIAVPEIKTILNREGANWRELHKVFNQHGLTLRPRGAGYVIQDLFSGLTVKASSVDRDFSKRKIEERIGPYKGAEAIHSSKERYEGGPIQRPSQIRDALWSQYLEDREKRKLSRSKFLNELRGQRREYLQNVFADIRIRKQEAYSSPILRYRQKKRVNAALEVERLKALEKARLMYANKREIIDTRYPVLTWTNFLRHKAENGDSSAVELLRQDTGVSIHTQANCFYGAAKQELIYRDMRYSVDKGGRIKYQLKDGWVLDTGKRVQPGSTDRNVLLAAIQIAIGKYGKKLKVNGDQKFLEQISRVACEMQMNVILNGRQVGAYQSSRKESSFER